MRAERRVGAMGSEAHVIVVGEAAEALADTALRRLDELEQRWSRFRPDSEVSRLNGAGGRPVRVSTDTLVLIICAVEGWRRTDGHFDPTVLDAILRAGYDRDLHLIDPTETHCGEPVPAPGCGGIRVDVDEATVVLPTGVAFDPGGVGKGLAADLVVDELRERGARGACVNVGGDLRVAGDPPENGGWRVAVEDPVTERAWGVLALSGAGVATSSTRRRRWIRGGAPVHHLVDPSTGASAVAGVTGVTVVAATAWEAEVAAKSVVVAGPAATPSVPPTQGAAAIVFHDDGRVGLYGEAASFLRFYRSAVRS